MCHDALTSPFLAGMWYNFPAMKNGCRNVGKGETLKRRVRVEIDLGALVRNYRKIVAHVKPMRVLSVLKANAYGLGVGAYAKALAEAGCREFGVAEPFEALELLDVLKRGGFAADVQILSSILPDEIAPMVKAGVILPVIDVATAKLISDAAKRAKRLRESTSSSTPAWAASAYSRRMRLRRYAP